MLKSLGDLLTAVAAQQAPAPEPEPVKQEARKVVAQQHQNANTASEPPISDAEQRVIASLKIEFGTWFEFEGGRKVAWYNSRTMHYMLVNQVGKKEAMLTGLELARKMLARKARIISGSSKPFFERALENIYKNMNNSVKAKTAAKS